MNVFIESPARLGCHADPAGCAGASGVWPSLWAGGAGARDNRAPDGYNGEPSGASRSVGGDARVGKRHGQGRNVGARPASDLAARSGAEACDFDLDEPEPYDVATNAYVEELAFDRKRTRGRRLARTARFIFGCVAVPLAAVFVFVVAYALTFILNGATPQQVADAMADLAMRIEALLIEVAAGLGRYAAHV